VDSEARERLEREVHALCDRSDFAAAATVALRGYGPEILGFLYVVHPAETDATDAFAELSEVLWRKLPDFGWESTLRTWAYGIARNVSRALRRNAGRRRRREAADGEAALKDVAEKVRTETLSFLRTKARTRLQALRDTLPEEDRMLLVLRVDRKLEWNELARVLAEAAETEEEAPPLDGAGVAREAARLRKRFQILKDSLRETARREGLIG
jgi:RNA polymerase sigma-70 factor (ECF subfamily)